MFVVMALVTTVATTPLTMALYPPWYQKKLESWKRGEIDWDGNPLDSDGHQSSHQAAEKIQEDKIRRLLVYLNLDSLSSLFTFIALLGGERPATVTKRHRSKAELGSLPKDTAVAPPSEPDVVSPRPLEVHGLRMIEVTERTSSVMQVAEATSYTHSDPVINTFRTFAQLYNMSTSGSVSVVPESSYAETLAGEASNHFSDLVLIPWREAGTTSGGESISKQFSGNLQDAFIQKVFEKATCNTAIFVNRGFGAPAVEAPPLLSRSYSGLSQRNQQETPVRPIADRSHHVYLPFFGGVDDRAALCFVLQLAQNSNITVTIIHFSTTTDSKSPATVSELLRRPSDRASRTNITSPGLNPEELRVEAAQETTLLQTLRDSLPTTLASRVIFVEVPTSNPVADALTHARQEVAQSPRNAGDLIVVGRGNHASISTAESDITSSSAGAEMRKTLGVVAETMVSGGVRSSVLVLQAARC
jgi:hypothetical protein